MKRRLLQMNKWRKMWNILQVFRYKIVLTRCNSAKKKINKYCITCMILQNTGQRLHFFSFDWPNLNTYQIQTLLTCAQALHFPKKMDYSEKFLGKKGEMRPAAFVTRGKKKKEKRKSYWRSAIGKAQRANTGKWLCRFRSWREKARLSFQSSTLVLDVPEPEWNDWN